MADENIPRSGDEKLLDEIRDHYRYASDVFKEAREERAIDMRYICGDPWEEEDRNARKDAGRPCINHDELSQYVNAAVNNLRQNPKGIKIEPAGNGASDQTAELRQGLVRSIEYRSQAQSTYIDAFQAMVEGSYGYARVTRRYLPGSFNQEILIAPIPNPDSVLDDPDSKKPDWSDARFRFVLDPMPKEKFKRQWPKAKVQDFSNEDMRVAKDWIQDKTVLVCEYWRIEEKDRTLYELEDGSTAYQLAKGQTARRQRPDPEKTVVQYMTNGVEILKRTEQPGEEIPIIPFIGLVRWIDEGGGAKRKIFSLVRLARDPQMSLAYLCSQEMEEAGLSPKVPYLGYTGQFETDAEAWDTLTKVPHAYVQADPIVDAATGQVLPLPQRQPFTPNFQSYEIAKDSARRAIMSAMGISPLPTAAQRNNEKSGIALERIESSQEIGSFHFSDNFERALAYLGRVVESWIPVTYDTEREVALRQADDSPRVVHLNTPAPYTPQGSTTPEHYPVDDSDHDVTISSGPSARSQREAAGQFLDLLIQNLASLPVPPPAAAKLLALAIKMKELGPKGDEMAEIISPDNNQQLPPQAQAQLDQAHGMIQQLTQALNAMTQKLQAKLPELATRERIALISAKAGVIEAALKAKSTEAIAAFNADIAQIDRMLSLMPDPGLETTSDGAPQQQQPTQPSGGAPAPAPQPQPMAPAA